MIRKKYNSIKLPPDQDAIRAKCFHPSGHFVEFPREDVEKSIPERFEKIVRLYPNRLAIEHENYTLTYDKLNEAANRIAQVIVARRGNDEEPVALLLEHGGGLVAAILGILKAGKFYVSLDPAFPLTRTAFMLEDSQAKLLLTDSRHLNRARQLTQDKQQIVNCDDIDASVIAGNPEHSLSGDTHALILYTSGSTGQPKGVLHNHRNILAETRNFSNDIGLCPKDKVALWHSFSYAKSNRNMYHPLLNGATLFPYDLANLGIAPLGEWMRTHRITILDTIPTTFRYLCGSVAPDVTFPALRVLRLGGEPISREDVILFQRHCCSPCALVHAIGPTEIFTTRRYFISHERGHDDVRVPLGYAVPEKEIILLDESGHEVGVNQVGEIAVRSKYLALGYWRRPELTRSSFLADPRNGDSRLYLTGDLGVMRPDGCLIHRGRKDFQVKIRGHRVEATEIEAALLRLDSVKEAVVQGQPDRRGEQRLVAYIVPSRDSVLTVSAVRRALRRSLPVYMIPSTVVFLDFLPLLPNGKVDRRTLPKPDGSRPALDVPFVKPKTLVEEKLAQIWSHVLFVDQVGIHDDFFGLGGHSLLATRVISKVIEEFRVEVPLQSLFQSPTIAEMAHVIARRLEKNLGDEDVGRILAELDSLSEEEAQRLLSNRSNSDTRK